MPVLTDWDRCLRTITLKIFIQWSLHLTFLSSPSFVQTSASPQLTLIPLPSAHCFHWISVVFMPTLVDTTDTLLFPLSQFQIKAGTHSLGNPCLYYCETRWRVFRRMWWKIRTGFKNIFLVGLMGLTCGRQSVLSKGVSDSCRQTSALCCHFKHCQKGEHGVCVCVS